MNRPRVLLVGNFLSLHTAVRGVCEDLADELRSAGWEVTTTSTARAPVMRGIDMVLTTARQASRVDLAQIDLYSGRAFLWAEMVTALLRAKRKSYVITVHGGGLPDFARRRTERVGRVLRGAAAVTAPSRFLARELAPYRDNIRVVPNGLEIERYPFRERETVGPRFVWLRAMHEVYDPVLAVRTVARLTDRFPEISLSMFGPDKRDDTGNEVRSAIAEAGLGERVTLEGAVAKNQVPEFLQTGDIFLNTSRIDNAPVTLVEPMACGLCVVTTDAGGIPDMVENGREALVVPVGDAETMARQIERLFDEPELAGRLSRNGRAVAERHAWAKVLPQWEALFEEVAGRA